MKTTTKAYLALATICVLWGTTYLVMKIGVATIPPFLFSGIRQLSAGVILLAVLPFFKKRIKLSWRDIGLQIIPGMLMIVLGNSVIGWAEQYIPSGLAALIVSAMPLYVLLINLMIGNGRQDMNAYIITGLFMGALGIGLIFRDNLRDLANSTYFWSIVACFAAALCWAAGTVYMKVKTFRTDAVVNSAIQFTSAGIVLLIVSLFTDDYSRLDTVSPESAWSLVYLIFFGSIIPFMCYLYAIEHLQVGLVSVYAYINPFIAIILGVLVLDERITWITGLAFLATAGGVYCINRGYSANHLKKKYDECGHEMVRPEI